MSMTELLEKGERLKSYLVNNIYIMNREFKKRKPLYWQEMRIFNGLYKIQHLEQKNPVSSLFGINNPEILELVWE